MISILTHPVERHRRTGNRIVPFLSWILMITGIISLGYVGYVIRDTIAYQKAATVRFESPTLTNNSQPLRSRPKVRRPIPGEVIGEVQVPRLGLKAIVVEGDSPRILRRAAGHVPSTVFPGEVGNVALAGHRDSIFRSLSQIRQGDIVTFDIPGQQFRYEVQSTQVVSPHEVGVLQSTAGRELTFITCFPFSYIGPAPNRFVVRAREIETGH